MPRAKLPRRVAGASGGIASFVFWSCLALRFGWHFHNEELMEKYKREVITRPGRAGYA